MQHDTAALPWRRAYVGLGANLGQRRTQMRAALRHLESQEVRLTRLSSLYETQPVGPVADQPAFLNAVVELSTTLPPLALLTRCLTIEASLGRERAVPKGPRVIDLDLLMIEDVVLDHPQLTLPHPELLRRAFALVPLLEIIPMAVDPRDGHLLCHHTDALLRSQGIVRTGSLTREHPVLRLVPPAAEDTTDPPRARKL